MNQIFRIVQNTIQDTMNMGSYNEVQALRKNNSLGLSMQTNNTDSFESSTSDRVSESTQESAKEILAYFMKNMSSLGTSVQKILSTLIAKLKG